MRILISLLLITSCTYSQVLVIDSGFNRNQTKLKTCLGLHENFTQDRTQYDFLKHGTNVMSIISKSNADFCIISYKIFGKFNRASGYVKALKMALRRNFKVINLSISGYDFDSQEFHTLKKLLDKGTHVVVAAGNDGRRLSYGCGVYPACYAHFFSKYSNFHVVGAKDSSYSNYGPIVRHWELGKAQGTPAMTGTSQAAANYTKKLVDILF